MNKLRWGVVLAATALPGVWLAGACGARTDISLDFGTGTSSSTGGSGAAAGHAGQGGLGGAGGLGGSGGVGAGGFGGTGAVGGGGGGLGGTGGFGGVGGHGGVGGTPNGGGGAGGVGGFPEDAGDASDAPEDVPSDTPIDSPSDVLCPDDDGDGYSTCDNDCNDNDPLINPGAFDFPNGKDDDCDGGNDNPLVTCGAGLQYTSQDPIDYAKAIDICQQTTLNAVGANKKWGLISAEFRLANGSGTPAPQSHSIITAFGSVLGPRHAQNFAFLSTGQAGTPSQPYFQPGATPQTGTDTGQTSATPLGFPTNKVGCPLPVSNTAFNPVNLKLKLRTPTNAASLAFDTAFWSAEYPEWACSVYNDLFVVLLTSGASGLPNNKNVLFDAQGTPGSVNLNFFDRCMAGATGCFGTPGFNFCSGGSSELGATGYGDPDFNQPCGMATSIGGGTGWMTTQAPILPGEIMTIEFITWDSSDPIYDSSAIVDFFRWQQTGLAGSSTSRP